MNDHESSKKSIEEIRDIMERSTTFVSLSGLSGIISGMLALMGVYILYVYFHSIILSDDILKLVVEDPFVMEAIFSIFVTIFIFALATSFILSMDKAKKKSQKVFNNSSKRFAFNLFIPIVSAIFIIIALIKHDEIWLIIPLTLIFYGMALINAGKYSRPEVLHLGIGCILSGILAMYFIEFGIILWGIGFGILNILTGITMYYKYDRKDN